MLSEESARSKVVSEETKVLESMENMDSSDLSARKAACNTTEEVTCPSTEVHVSTHQQFYSTPDKKKKKSKEP